MKETGEYLMYVRSIVNPGNAIYLIVVQLTAIFVIKYSLIEINFCVKKSRVWQSYRVNKH